MTGPHSALRVPVYLSVAAALVGIQKRRRGGLRLGDLGGEAIGKL